MSEWASKNVVGLTCPMDQGGWSKKVFSSMNTQNSIFFYQNPQSELFKIRMAFRHVDRDL